MIGVCDSRKEDASDVTQGHRFLRSFHGPVEETESTCKHIMTLFTCTLVSFCGAMALAATCSLQVNVNI